MNGAAAAHGVPGDTEDPSTPVDLLLARRFHRDAGIALMGHPVVAMALAILIWGLVPAWQVGLLVVGVLLATMARSALHRRAAARSDDAVALRRHTRTSTLVVAAAWGVTGIFLLPQVVSGIEARILLFLAGLTAAGAATHVADIKGFRLFAGLLLGPAMVGVVLNGYDANTGADLVVIAAFWATMVVIQRRTHDQLVEQLTTRARLQQTSYQATREKEFLDAVLESAPDGLALLDPEGRLTRMNDVFRQMLWTNPGREAPQYAEGGSPKLKAFRGTDALWDALWGVSRDLANTPVGASAEREVVVTRGGRRAWYTVSASRGQDEAEGWTVLQIEDDTSLRRAEEGRREAEAEYAGLVETANDLIWRVDREGHWTFLNRAAEKIYGVPPHTLLGTSALDRALEERRDADREALAGILRGGELIDYETPHRRADGEVRWLSFSARPVREDGGSIVGAQGVARDVTAQVEGRQTLERLAERNSLVHSLVNASEDLIFYKDAQGVYQGCNRAFAEFVGLSENEIVGRTDHDLYPSEEAADFTATDREVLRTGEPWVGESWEEMGTDGERRLLETVKTAYVDTDGSVLGILGISRDVTARKEAEERLRHAAAEAHRATQMKSAFLANMSHEIRTPMNGVLGMTELLHGTALDPEQRQYVDIVRSSAQNLLGILNDILDFSKIEAGHIGLESVPFELAGEMADAVRVLSVQAAEKNNELILDVDPELPPWMVGDPGRIRQVVTNLLGNAVKFTENGEIELSVERAGEPDEPGRPHRVRIAVRDTGIGISDDKLPFIFEEFNQADTSVTRRFGGTGLGLTISRRLVDLMGGEIGVESRPGEGSTFWFTLPLLAADPPESVPARPAADASSLRGAQILIVDDNETNRSILHRTLADAGAVVEEAVNGPEGLERVHEMHREGRPPHLIVMDVQMPDMDGFEVVRRLRTPADDGGPGRIPILVLTSANRTEDAARARQLGVEAYHIKPLPRRDLLQVAATLVDRAPGPGGAMEPFPPSGDIRTPPPPSSLGRTGGSGVGLRVLLAEDNPVNRMVAETVLRKQGYEVTTAITGAEAVEAVLAGGIHAILMDVQMPEMDGIEATRAIRGLAPPLLEVPIIALTAHALDEERQRCMNAGMDDFLSKPFQADDLLDVLHRWATSDRARRASGAPAEAVGAAADASDPPLGAPPDTGAVEAPPPFHGDAVPPVDVGEFRAVLDEAGIGEIADATLQLFLQDLPARATAVEVALASGDPREISGAAHALKSSAANVRAKPLAELLGRLERDARAGDLSGSAELGRRIFAEVERVRAFLESP